MTAGCLLSISPPLFPPNPQQLPPQFRGVLAMEAGFALLGTATPAGHRDHLADSGLSLLRAEIDGPREGWGGPSRPGPPLRAYPGLRWQIVHSI